MDLGRSNPLNKWPSELPEPSQLQRCLHRHHWSRLTRLLWALSRCHDMRARAWAIRLAGCCHHASLSFSPESGETRPWLSTCGSRLCPFCGRGRATRLARRLRVHIASMKRPKHLVLTFRSRDLPLPSQLQLLRRAFAKLRRTRVWRDAVAGGVYSIEVTRNNETGLWHPHLHTVIDAKFMPQAVIARLWGSFIGDTAFVWIRQVTDPANMAWELGKYVGKPPDTRGWPDNAIIRHANALHGQRMMQTFGNLHAVKVPKLDEPTAVKPDTEIISIPRISYLASKGIPIAQDLAAVIYARWPMFRTYLEHRWPQVQAAEISATMPQHAFPRAPPGPDGRPGVLTDPKQLQELEILTQLLSIHWLNLDAAGGVSQLYEYMETGT